MSPGTFKIVVILGFSFGGLFLGLAIVTAIYRVYGG